MCGWRSSLPGGWFQFGVGSDAKERRGWPTADGRIESVEINKPSFSFTTKHGYYVAELGYSYAVAGTLNSGRYKREFPTEQEADEFVRDLQDKAVVVHYNPGKPSSSAMLESDIAALLQNRPPSSVPERRRQQIIMSVFASSPLSQKAVQLSGCANGNFHIPSRISARGRNRRTV
jgi:hypothetical protein